MEKLEIIYLFEANNDIEEIFLFLKKDDYDNAVDVTNKLLMEIRKLETFPYLGSIVSVGIGSNIEFRKLVIDNYIVFYTVRDNIYNHIIIHCIRNISKIIAFLK